MPVIQRPLIFISAAEPSADLHGSALIRAVHRLRPEARFVGVAGPRMVHAGCDRIFDMTGDAAMLLGAVRSIRRGVAMLMTSERHLRMFPFDAAVVIDSPTLHLPLALRAKCAGVPVLYYIAPQLWAWGAHRIHKLRDRADRVAVILPFEESYLRNGGVDATFVGHPLAETMNDAPPNMQVVEELGSKGQPFIALLPGSRKHVVREVLPGQLAVARAILNKFPSAAFGVSVAGDTVEPIVHELLRGNPPSIRAYPNRHRELIDAADLVLVASGTTALEVAFCRRPMIVMYNASKLFYHLFARWMIRTPHLSLPNILAQRKVVPEFMPYYRSTDPIAERAIELLRSSAARDAMVADLESVIGPLRGGRPSEKTAALLLGMIDTASH